MQFNENCEELGEIGLKVLMESKTFRKNVKNEDTGEAEKVKTGSDKSETSEDKYAKRGPMQHYDVEKNRHDQQNDTKAKESMRDAQVGAEQEAIEGLIKTAWGNIDMASKRLSEAARQQDWQGIEANKQEIEELSAKIKNYEQQLKMLGGGRQMQ